MTQGGGIPQMGVTMLVCVSIGKGSGADLQYAKELRNLQSSKKDPEMAGQSGLSRYGKDLKTDWKKHFGFTVDCYCNFSSAWCYSLRRAFICGAGNMFQVTKC